jgi:hypothetical protein
MMSPDDTQPKSPFAQERQRPQQQQVYEQKELIDPNESAPSGGPGCFVWGCVSVVGLGFAVAIVALAGLAGWTSGQRTAGANATATLMADINAQCSRIPEDMAVSNTVLVERRIGFLATMTPGVPCVAEFIPTATALYLTQQPTATIAATATLQATATVQPEATEELETQSSVSVDIPTPSDSGYDLESLLQEAQEAIRAGDYNTAIELLDVITGVDSSYDSANVRSLLREALSEEALIQFRTGNLAQGIVLTDRAEEFGALAEGLNYERYVATLYLDALSTIGTDYYTSISALRRLYDEVPNYRNGEIAQMLFDAYVSYGDAFAIEGNQCSAQQQYQNALNIFSRGDVVSKRDNAQEACENPTPAVAGTPGTPGAVAPVGQVQ